MSIIHTRHLLCMSAAVCLMAFGLSACQKNGDSVDRNDPETTVQDTEKESSSSENSKEQMSEGEDLKSDSTVDDADTASDGDSDVIVVDLSDMDDPAGDAYANIRTYSSGEYGTIETNHQSTLLADGTECYYYEIEEYYFNDSVKNASTINETLRGIYQEVETGYEADSAYYQNNSDPSEYYEGEGEPEIQVPYNYYKFYDLYYVGDDYVSLVYNDVYYLGGAHPYSNLYGITIDVNTGKQVSASEVTGQSDADILNMIKKSMGMDIEPTWEDVDYYITNTTIVYFYRQPNFYEDVQTVR